MPTPPYDELLTPLELLVMDKAFVQEYTFGPLQVRIKNIDTEFPKGLDVVRGPNLFKSDTKIMRIKATVIVKAGTPTQLYY